MKDSFVFYKSFYDAIHKLPNKELKADIFEAICELALNENNIELDDSVGQIIMDLIRPQILANNKRYVDGKKGGRPRKNNEEKTTGYLEAKTTGYENKKPNVNVNENVNVNVNRKENIKEKKNYGEFKNVKLTDEEYEKIKNSNLLPYIEKLSSYIESKGKKYKSHYATILTWSRKESGDKGITPSWFKKEIKEQPLSEEEKKEMDELLKSIID